MQHVVRWRQTFFMDQKEQDGSGLIAYRESLWKEIIMKRFTHGMESLFNHFGWHGIVPTGRMPPDNTEAFDTKRQPEQYSEFIDKRRPNEM